MGVDVSLYVETKQEVDGKKLFDLNRRFKEANNLSSAGIEDIGFYKDEESDFEQRFRVYTLSRYYGTHYSRGNWPNIRMAIKWLEYNFPDGSVVKYGGDSMADRTRPATEERIKEIDKHWFENGNLTYRKKEPKIEKYKKTCKNCDEIMTRTTFGHGGDLCGLYCNFCGRKIRTEDGGESWEVKKEGNQSGVTFEDLKQ